jgi:NAD(P)-dependent dehydrogenase (short-subunit alcohol dehydrogenase family)
MIIVNGINSEIVKKILPKFLRKNKVIGIYNTSYKGIRDKNLTLFNKNKIDFKRIDNLLKNDQKISFLNFATKKDEGLIIRSKKKELNDILKNNIVEPIELLKKFLPYMIDHNFGRIIFFSSSAAENGYPGNLGYSTSKSAFSGIMGTIAKEYKNFNITCNIISLGYFETKMWKSLPTKNKVNLLNNTLSKKLCNPLSVYEMIKIIIKYNEFNLSKIHLDGGNLLR